MEILEDGDGEDLESLDEGEDPRKSLRRTRVTAFVRNFACANQFTFRRSAE